MIYLFDKVYAAGFFDADGTVGVYFKRNDKYKRGGYYRLQVSITQKDPHILTWYLSRWGGCICFDKQGGTYRWAIAANKAAAFLRDIEPFVKGKHEQVVLAIEFQDKRRRLGGKTMKDERFAFQEDIANKIKGLKKRRI